MNDPNVPPAKHRRRWLSFGLRGLLGLVLVVALMLGWLSRPLFQSQYEKATARQVEEAGGTVRWEDPLVSNPFEGPGPEPTTYQSLMIGLFGRDVLARIDRIFLPTAELESVHVRLPKLEKIRVLALVSGTISDSSIDALIRLDTLTSLVLNDTKIEPSQIERLAQLPKLDHLNISGGSVTKPNLAAWGQCPQLTTLFVRCHCDSRVVDPSVLESLAHLKQVTTLELIDFRINDNVLQAIGQMSSLEWLSLQGDELADNNVITPEGVSALISLKHLETLYTYFIPFDDESLQPIGRLPKLDTFRCDSSHITDVGLSHLNQLSNLKSLRIGKCQASPEMLRELNTTHPKAVLNLGQLPGIRIGNAEGTIELETLQDHILIEPPEVPSKPTDDQPGGVF